MSLPTRSGHDNCSEHATDSEDGRGSGYDYKYPVRCGPANNACDDVVIDPSEKKIMVKADST